MINRGCIVRWLFAAVIIFMFLPGSVAAQEKTSITVEWIYSEAGKNVASLPSFFWLDDGKLVLFDRQKPKSERILELFDPETGSRTPLLDGERVKHAFANQLEEEPSEEDAEEEDEDDARRFLLWPETISGDGRWALYTLEKDLFLLDLSASMTGGFGIWSARQMAARICACLALSANSNDDGVGLIAFSRDVDKFIPPRKGVRHVLRIVRDCLALPGSSVQTDMAAALEFVSHVMRRRAILFVMSDFLTSGWGKALGLCARHHDVVAVRLLTPELAPPQAGLVRLRDPESGRWTVLDWRSRRVRAAYAARVEAWREQTAEDLRRARVDLMDVPVPREYDRDAVARPILAFFRMREQREKKR